MRNENKYLHLSTVDGESIGVISLQMMDVDGDSIRNIITGNLVKECLSEHFDSDTMGLADIEIFDSIPITAEATLEYTSDGESYSETIHFNQTWLYE